MAYYSWQYQTDTFQTATHASVMNLHASNHHNFELQRSAVSVQKKNIKKHDLITASGKL